MECSSSKEKHSARNTHTKVNVMFMLQVSCVDVSHEYKGKQSQRKSIGGIKN